MEVVQETTYGVRIVVGQIHTYDVVAVELFAGGPSGGCGVGQQDLVTGVGCTQLRDQALGGAGLPNRDGM